MIYNALALRLRDMGWQSRLLMPWAIRKRETRWSLPERISHWREN